MVRMNDSSVARQKGQVFPLALAVLAVACVMFFVVFNSGRAVNEKINLVNAADASAYSGAQIAARHLNFMAYTNRAMIANEAAIGHLYSFQIEADLLSDVSTGFIRKLAPGFLGIFVEPIVQFIQAVATGSKVFTGMLTLMLDANNASFTSFQEQAYSDLIRQNEDSGYTIIDQTMLTVASSYIQQNNARIQVNSPETLSLFENSEDLSVSNAAYQAGRSAIDLCEMILFATPGAESPDRLGASNNARAQNCAQAVNTGVNLSTQIPGAPGSPESDGGLMLGAIRETVANMENATWIRDRNTSYSIPLIGSATRTGSTEIRYDPTTQKLNWAADADSLTVNTWLGSIPASHQGDAAQNVEDGVARFDYGMLQFMRGFGLCGDDNAIDCETLTQERYQSIQRFAALDPNRQSTTFTAFLSQNNCSDGIGSDADGARREDWRDGLQPFEEREKFCGKVVYAIGKAEVYFQRPDCYDAQGETCDREGSGFARLNGDSVEVPNLFNPFWHARLVATE